MIQKKFQPHFTVSNLHFFQQYVKAARVPINANYDSVGQIKESVFRTQKKITGVY